MTKFQDLITIISTAVDGAHRDGAHPNLDQLVTAMNREIKRAVKDRRLKTEPTLEEWQQVAVVACARMHRMHIETFVAQEVRAEFNGICREIDRARESLKRREAMHAEQMAGGHD